jgi:hypothetical protein
MTIPSVDHLFWLRHDPDRFEAERNRLISDYIKSLPEENRTAAYAMQCKIDAARMTMSSDELLQWMVREAAELNANLSDQFSFIGHKAADMKKTLNAGSAG